MNTVESAAPATATPKQPPASSPLGFKEKLGYGLGDTASHFVWDMVGFWLLFFYTDVYRIPAAAAGTIMMVARFWDMAIDPVIGIVSDRTQTRWGKFRPYILFGAVPYAALSILTFTTPNLGETGKIIYAGATYVLLMTAYAAVNLPYSSLAAVMSSDTYERAGLNTYRFICAFIGQFVVTGLALTLAKFFGGGDKARGFQHTVILFGLLSLVFFFITFMTTRERVQPSTTLPSSLKEDVKNLFKNQPWIILACVGIISFIMFAIQNAAVAYYFKYYIGQEESVQLFNVIGTVALIVALPLSKPLARKFGNRNVFIASSILSGLFFVAIYLPGKNDIAAIYVFNILAKMAYAPAVPLALDHDRRLGRLFRMEERPARDGPVFLGGDLRPKSRLGHRRRDRRMVADRVQLCARCHPDPLRVAGHQAARVRHSRRALHVLRALYDLLHD